jgi:hypothetical protein
MNDTFWKSLRSSRNHQLSRWCACALVLYSIHCAVTLPAWAAAIAVPNGSFESPAVPPVSPYASPEIDYWQKSPQPAWYDPSQNANTPWAYLMGEFYNVPFPGQFIDNCDGTQAMFLFALPEAAVFQDYSSVYGTNDVASHAFNARFNTGSSYDLTVGVLGGGGGMKPGVTLQLQLYYRDGSSNMVVVGSTSITNSAELFPTNTHFVDFSVHVPQVKPSDPWAGQNIGIQLASTVDFTLAGGYWDLDNVRLVESGTPLLTISGVTNGVFSVNVQSGAGARFQIETATNLATSATWSSLGVFTNGSGVISLQENATNSVRFYRAHQL